MRILNVFLAFVKNDNQTGSYPITRFDEMRQAQLDV